MNKVAIYARVSTVDNQIYDRQISDLTKVINNHGYNINQIEIFAEKLSGYDKERPQLNKLISEASNYKCIYISEISRLGRDPSHTRKIIDDLTDKNIPIYIQSIGQSTLNPDGSRNTIMSIILQVLMEFAHSEAETMKTRMKSGKLEAVKSGKVAGNNQAYGYANVDKMQVIDEDEAMVVEKIFQMYLEGKGTRVIAGILNDMKIPTRLAKTHKDKTVSFEKTGIEKSGADILWDGNTILQMIKNPIYKGTRIFKGEKIPTPQIISEEIWEQANTLRTTKTHRNYLTSYTYLLKDFCYCGKCGKKYLGTFNLKKSHEFYRCVSFLKKGQQCGNAGININLIESVIYHQLIQSENLLKYLDNPNDILNQIKAELSDIELQFKLQSNVLASKERELERLLDLYLSNPSYKKELFENKEKELSNEIEALNKKISILKKQIFDKQLTVANYDKETATKEMLINAKNNRTELQTIFKQFINKIYINTLNKRFALITLEIKINGVIIPNTLKLIIDVKKSHRRGHNKVKSYQYIAVSKMENNPVFKNNVLMNDLKDIEEEVEKLFELAEKVKDVNQNILPDTIDIVPEENWLSINPK
ncbi:DNA invertase Pin-like site-specific DNA recombinase [Flavobacterium aquaticum]|uniref:DNA invertase Pin-like site-specific DNA recombinase n=1 Tax=Flavobacterium aquaticum TaxID=1236486 RepID=A0A327YPP3_9FLAO|nr:recombinase family protein [Flavobacterium aquaticum]RAK21635.1 DNA invertase Pin-like site-specific DNA recombinase [Flavobacterium aquaticum]